ncbi:hypothetical protein RYX36_004145 [Vicia faba]
MEAENALSCSYRIAKAGAIPFSQRFAITGTIHFPLRFFNAALRKLQKKKIY